jgi:hypothetical protein
MEMVEHSGPLYSVVESRDGLYGGIGDGGGLEAL